eukprot:6509930-Prorocentrum_lima.AAC.1
MTSSLVGSEMCIRDRNNARSKAQWLTTSPLRPCALTLGQNSPLGGEEAVSYTHLTLPTICSV